MIIPVLDRWEAGDQPNDVMFNKLMDIINFVSNPPEGHFTSTATPTISPGSWTPISFTSAVRDTESEFDAANPMWSVSDPTKIYIKTKGWYELELFSSWGSAADSSRRIHAIRVDNAAELYYRGRHDQRTAGTNKVRSVYDMYFDPPSYIELLVYNQAAGGLPLADGGTVGSRTGLRLKWYSL